MKGIDSWPIKSVRAVSTTQSICEKANSWLENIDGFLSGLEVSTHPIGGFDMDQISWKDQLNANHDNNKKIGLQGRKIDHQIERLSSARILMSLILFLCKKMFHSFYPCLADSRFVLLWKECRFKSDSIWRSHQLPVFSWICSKIYIK